MTDRTNGRRETTRDSTWRRRAGAVVAAAPVVSILASNFPAIATQHQAVPTPGGTGYYSGPLGPQGYQSP
ncbi:hypothetical protein ACFQ9X_30395 [Catenulispora yoronensis]